MQRIVIHWFYFYNINYGVPEVRDGDLTGPQTYRIVQEIAGRGELGAALAGLSLADYQAWARGNDRWENR